MCRETGRSALHVELGELQALLDVLEEAAGVGAVDQLVVVGQRQVDHVPHRGAWGVVPIVLVVSLVFWALNLDRFGF